MDTCVKAMEGNRTAMGTYMKARTIYMKAMHAYIKAMINWGLVLSTDQRLS